MPDSNDSGVPRFAGAPRSGDAQRHDGRLRPVVGVHEVQVVRSNPAMPARADGQPFDFRHHPFLMYWQSRFWVYHLGAKGDEPSSKRGILQWSSDGLNWQPRDTMIAFPKATHQRAAFYVASNGRALVSTWHGRGEDARGEKGSRLVREVLGPGALGPIYQIKANHRGPAEDLDVDDFSASPDAGFRAACEELLANRLYTQQWQEEDQDPSFYAVNRLGTAAMARAFAWYELKDGRIVGMWKGPHLLTCAAADWQTNGKPVPIKEKTRLEGNRLVEFDQFGANGGSKQWGQRTADGRYAMVFNAPGELHKRWPLAVTTSADGIVYDSPLLCISGDISPQRYPDAEFDHKDGGPAYVRGIEPGLPVPDDDAMWLTYSLNKEDIWVARVPVPIRDAVQGDVDDDFSTIPHDNDRVRSPLRQWNIRSAREAPVGLRAIDGRTMLCLHDKDAVDYARAVRVFEQSCTTAIDLSLVAFQTGHGLLCIDVLDAQGRRAVRVRLEANGQIAAESGSGSTEIGTYVANRMLRLGLSIDCAADRVHVTLDDQPAVEMPLAEAVETVERIELRTGAYRLDAFDRIGVYALGFAKTSLDGADAEVPEAGYGLTRLRVRRMVR